MSINGERITPAYTINPRVLMFGLSTGHRFLLYSQPTDMRKSFDALCGVITAHLGKDPRNGAVYMFINKRRDKVKLLHWMGSGFVLYYKRLEQGTFAVPTYDARAGSLRLSYAQIVMLIDGISITNIMQKKRYMSTVESE